MAAWTSIISFLPSWRMPSAARTDLEAGSFSNWLHKGLTDAGFDAVLIETRQVKTDSEGIAPLLRMDCFWLVCPARRCRRRRCGRC